MVGTEDVRQAGDETSRTPLISVVIPCYNAATYVAEAISSVLSQEYENLQIIVVNDGSTDDSEQAIMEFSDRIEYITQDNAGISAARNAGLAVARGSLIAFLDSDDLWCENSLGVRLSCMNQNPEVDYVFGKVEAFRDKPENGDEGAADYQLPQTAGGRLGGSLLIRGPSFFRVGVFDTDLRVGETIDWLLRAQEAGLKGREVDYLVLRRRVHDTNTVTQETELKSQYLHALKASIERRKKAQN